MAGQARRMNMTMQQEVLVLKRDADKLGIDLDSAEYGYTVSPADVAGTPEEAEAIAREMDDASQHDLASPHGFNSGVHHG
jgi:hypothetical protein